MSATAFWAAVFYFAFGAFALVSALIAVRGVEEIRALFRHLDVPRDDDHGRPGRS